MTAGPDGGLRRVIHGRLPMVHWQAIETGATGSGVPDSNGCYRGAEFWVECKHTTAYAVGLEPKQVGWIDRRWRAGGRVWVAVWRQHGGGPRRGVPTSELFLFPGSVVRRLALVGLHAAPEIATGWWAAGPARWAWADILRTLCGPCGAPSPAPDGRGRPGRPDLGDVPS